MEEALHELVVTRGKKTLFRLFIGDDKAARKLAYDAGFIRSFSGLQTEPGDTICELRRNIGGLSRDDEELWKQA